ncbi:NAD(P)/FAD-dependent oxidoreductase [Cupriavidus sp. CV2]|uniref:flavin-containing monooxygenase n=1 Tax=Cupriavidus ulmosensis TaxID=3065913 RepID=UPI00296AAA0E|nr:NAD(P)/FAD-dependent oxidoreductase [Cupriavidus sp. CV2]MDW3686338.1 NAD(P)/FAD-dependent oxidoreductase [Cupriavidus sp. CV2]
MKASTTPGADQIVIIGAGVAGMCMGIRLKQAGIDDFVILEKAGTVGGTWRDNTYPGCGCDIPSHLYSFSFAPKPDWSSAYSPQPEIHRYLQHCAERFGLLGHIHFGIEVTEARYDEGACLWQVSTGNGDTIAARILVSGTGQLNRPLAPDIPGLDSFAGTAFHCARWRHDADLRGKQVAVIGNGASALQFIPRIAPEAGKLTVFQRSANWVLPRNGEAYTVEQQARFGRHHPWTARLHRWHLYLQRELRFGRMQRDSGRNRELETLARRYLAHMIADPALRAKLTPDYPIGCKRILISDDFYQALKRPNVQVETTRIARVDADAVVTADGARHPADAIIFATGFDARSFLAPIRIHGRHGRTLADQWREDPEAYLGMTAPGFPNLFVLYGPNTNLGHNSIIFMLECQARYVLQCIQACRSARFASMEVRPEVVTRFNQALQAAIGQTAWAGSCSSWYKSASGRVINNWSSHATAYWWKTRKPDWGHFVLRHAGKPS